MKNKHMLCIALRLVPLKDPTVDSNPMLYTANPMSDPRYMRRKISGFDDYFICWCGALPRCPTTAMEREGSTTLKETRLVLCLKSQDKIGAPENSLVSFQILSFSFNSCKNGNSAIRLCINACIPVSKHLIIYRQDCTCPCSPLQ